MIAEALQGIVRTFYFKGTAEQVTSQSTKPTSWCCLLMDGREQGAWQRS